MFVTTSTYAYTSCITQLPCTKHYQVLYFHYYPKYYIHQYTFPPIPPSCTKSQPFLASTLHASAFVTLIIFRNLSHCSCYPGFDSTAGTSGHFSSRRLKLSMIPGRSSAPLPSFLESRDLQGIMDPVSNLDVYLTSMLYNYVASLSPDSGRRAWPVGEPGNAARLGFVADIMTVGTRRFLKLPATDVCKTARLPAQGPTP